MMFTEGQTPPLISCLLVTAKGRFHHLQRSVKCYLDQTYSNKELVVVNEGPKEYQQQLDTWFLGLNRPDIRTVWLDGYYTLGALRNISISMSLGEIYCQWDDDDFCMPQRLAVQYAHLQKHKAKACYFGDQLHYYFPNRELYWDNWRRYHSGGYLIHSVVPGTAMISRELNIRYPALGSVASAGEDSVFLERLLTNYSKEVAVIANQGYIHMYSYHGDNQVYPLEHHLAISQHRCQPLVDILQYKAQICDTLNYLDLPGDTRVMCREGLAFIHKGKHGSLS